MICLLVALLIIVVFAKFFGDIYTVFLGGEGVIVYKLVLCNKISVCLCLFLFFFLLFKWWINVHICIDKCSRGQLQTINHIVKSRRIDRVNCNLRHHSLPSAVCCAVAARTAVIEIATPAVHISRAVSAAALCWSQSRASEPCVFELFANFVVGN